MKSKLWLLTGVFCLFAPILARAEVTNRFQFFNMKPEVIDNGCEAYLAGPPTGKTRLQDEGEVVLAAWNFENILEMQGKHEMGRLDPVTRSYIYEPKPEQNRVLQDWKFHAKQDKILNVTKYLNRPEKQLPHFIVGTEIESLAASNELLNTQKLAGQYVSYLVKGNDSRNINIAFGVRADLDVVVEVESHRQAEWIDPAEGARGRLFSRDLPVLIVRDRQTRKVLLILVGNHGKSKRDRRGDPESTQFRTAQYQGAAQILQSYFQRFGTNAPIVMAGDFNADVRNSPEVAPLKALMKDALDLSRAENRITQTYYPPTGGIVASQLDGVLLSPFLSRYLRQALVLPEFDHITGALLPTIPPSYQARTEQYPSDHRATAIVIDGRAFSFLDSANPRLFSGIQPALSPAA